ncbi:SRPBCC family protein [Oxalobacteraceae bacterium]|nr:SRPBCC family protein [Oxalobacteraceae bacterium]
MTHTQSHSIVCNAPAAAVYAVICQSEHWPKLFEPCLAVEVLERSDAEELIRVTARVNGEPMSWESRRAFRREIFGIDTQVIKTMQFVESMQTSWRVVQLNPAQSVLVLEHEYSILPDVAGQNPEVETQEQARAFIARAISANSTRELGNIRDALEQGSAPAAQEVARSRSTSHSTLCHASAPEVYALIADAGNWPKIFDSCVSATAGARLGNSELVHIEAMQEGKVVGWDTLRRYHDDIFRIDFHLPVPMPFLQEMRGQWRVIPIDGGSCVLNVTRYFELLDDVSGIREGITTHAQASALVNRFIDDNAGTEMQAVKSFVENRDAAFSAFSARYTLPYAPDQVFEVLADASRWPEVLPHCSGVSIIYDDGQNQEFVMDINTAHGTEHFRSIRKCERAALEISYFQPKPPALLRTHSGRWLLRACGSGTEVTSSHVVQLNPLRCAEQFDDADLRRNKQRVKELVMKNSKATVEACGRWLDQIKVAA